MSEREREHERVCFDGWHQTSISSIQNLFGSIEFGWMNRSNEKMDGSIMELLDD